MPHISLYFPDQQYSHDQLKAFMDRLAAQAAALGYCTGRGVKAGRGNVRRLLEAIANQEVTLQPPLPEDLMEDDRLFDSTSQADYYQSNDLEWNDTPDDRTGDPDDYNERDLLD